MRQRCEDWTTIECVEGGLVTDGGSGGSGSGDNSDDGQFASPTGATPDQIADAITLASDILFGLTERKYTGACGPRSIRPCSRYPNGNPAWPALRFQAWQRADFLDWWAWDSSWGTCGCGGNPCSCTSISRIGLGVYPLLDATVRINGDTLDPAAYTIIEHQWLDRLDGEQWPLCSNPDADPSDDNTFEVLTRFGIEIPEGGLAVACFYARQIALGMAGQPCELPSRLATLVRQGTTMTFRDPTDLVAKGLTGVDLVDQWIAADLGVGGRQAPSTFIVPGVARNRAQLGPARP